MCFHVSRFDARLSDDLEMVDLEHQDRTKYNWELIQIGIDHLEGSGIRANRPSSYHLEAAVSYYHCTAPSFKETDWLSTLHLYDLHLKQQYSPIVALNRVVPFYMVHGAGKARELLQQYKNDAHYMEIALFHAISAEVLRSLEDKDGAREALKTAITLARNELEKKHLHRKIQALELYH